jgi:hypothetical protein
MSSTLYVDSLIEKTSGNGVHIPGHVIQVVKKVVDQSSHSNMVSTSYLDITNSALSITPKYTNSIIRFTCSIYLHAQPGCQFGYSLFRDSTDLSSLYNSGKFGSYGPGGTSDPTYDRFHAVMSDTPNTTSATTYSIRFYREAGSASLYVHSNGINEFYLEEIAQ